MGWFDGWLWVFGIVGKTAVSRIIEVFEYARCRYGCDVFVIDSLMRLGVGSEDYEGQEKAVFELVSWAVGAAFGRFDVRLALSDASALIEPEPFGAAEALSFP